MFPKIFRVSNELLQAKTLSIKSNFNYPGKLFDIKEFDIYNEEEKESYNNLALYIEELDNKNKHKLVNIIFNDENLENSYQFIETSYHIVHSHVLSICLRKEKEIGRKGLLRDFLTRMRISAKQRIINEKQISMMNKEDGNGLTLAQKIKILINLNRVQYQKVLNEAEKLY